MASPAEKAYIEVIYMTQEFNASKISWVTYCVALEVEEVFEHQFNGIHVEGIVVNDEDLPATIRDLSFPEIALSLIFFD